MVRFGRRVVYSCYLRSVTDATRTPYSSTLCHHFTLCRKFISFASTRFAKMASFECTDKSDVVDDVTTGDKSYGKAFMAIPVEEEHVEPMETAVKGTIPEWLSGSLLRNGPGIYKVGQEKFKHFFDGLALLHRYNIKDGKVVYHNRFLRSDDYKEAIGTNRIATSGFGTFAYPDPCKNIFQRFFSYFSMHITDNDAVALTQIGEEFYALTETPYIRRIDPVTLDTLGEKVDYSKVVAVTGASAHPHVDPDGTVYNIGVKYGRYCSYNIIKIPPPDEGVTGNPLQKASIVCTMPISQPHPSYYHSFGLTENYFIFFEQPVLVNVWKLILSPFYGRAYADNFDYHPELCTPIRVFDRKSGQEVETKYFTDALFVFHHINAFEKDGHLVIDLIGYDNINIIKELYMEELQAGIRPKSQPKPWRYVLPLNIVQKEEPEENLVTLEKTTATAVRVDDGRIHCRHEDLIELDGFTELPRINYERNGKDYRYVYTAGDFMMSLMKIDIETKTSKTWEEKDAHPSEPVFVPKPGATKEDEGVVLSSVMTVGENNPSFLLVLDGETFEEIARAEVPVHVTYSLHGLFKME
ncbi:beta,beta-carotene 15,15'-dioxygenase-like [Glandiceps talaboti]